MGLDAKLIGNTPFQFHKGTIRTAAYAELQKQKAISIP